MFHNKRMQYRSEMPGFPSEEWKLFAIEHPSKAILCSDKVNAAVDFIEAARLMVSGVTWTAISYIENYFEPETEFDLSDQLDLLFQFWNLKLNVILDLFSEKINFT